MQHRTLLIGIVTAAALLGAACSGGDVSQAEYDQKVAELTLAQQDLYDARDALTTATMQAEEAATGIDTIVAEADILLGVGDDPVAVIINTIEAGREEVLYLSREAEAALERAEGSPGAGPQLEALLEVAAITGDWLRPGYEPDAEELANLADVVATADDEMVRLAFEDLQAGYEEATAEERIGLIAAVNFWAIDIARSLITSGA